jgi:hypothetical protein
VPHRFVCTVLEEMRTAVRVGRVDLVIGLIEEAQTLVNRMEAKLGEYNDMAYDLRKARSLRNDLKEIQDGIDEIEDTMDG